MTLVDQDHIGWRSWKLSARTVSPTPSLFIAPKAIHLLPGEHGEILGRLEVGWGKVAISLKRLEIEEKLLLNAYRNSLSRSFVSPTTYGLLFPKIGGLQPLPKTPITFISGMDEAMDFKFGWNIHRVHPNKRPLKFLIKRIVGVSRECPNFLGAPSYLRSG